MQRAFFMRALVVLTAVIALALAGCKTQSRQDSGSGRDTEPRTNSEFDDGSRMESEDLDPGSSRPAAGALKSIYFDYDRAEIRPDARPQLRANADEMTAG